MTENFSYILSIFKYTGPVIVLTFLVGYKHLKVQLKAIFKVCLIGVLVTAPLEGFAIANKGWAYLPQTTFNTLFLGAEVETYIFSLFVSLTTSSVTILLLSFKRR